MERRGVCMFRLGSRHWIRPKVAFAAAGSAAVLLAAGGTALAVTPGTAAVAHGQVQGCYSRSSGALRVLTAHAPHCKASEKAISWPQSVNGYASTFKFNAVDKFLTIKLEPVAVLKLAPGSSYIVSASTNLESEGPDAFDWAQCEFLDGTKTVIGFGITTIPFDSSAGFGVSTLSSTAYSPDGGIITMKCSDQHAEAIAFNWDLTAVQVTHLTLGPEMSGAAPRGTTLKLPSAG